MIIPSGYSLTSEQKRKLKFYSNVMANGLDVTYDPFPDVLFSDVNKVVTDKHLAISMLRHLDEDVAEAAEKLLLVRGSTRETVESVAYMIRGRTILELMEATEKAVREVKVPKYISTELAKLKPSRLVFFTNTPSMTANYYIRKKVDPLYNVSGDIEPITVFATELEHLDGIFTGKINSSPNDKFRDNFVFTYEERALKKYVIEQESK